MDIGRQRVANIIQFYSQPRLERILGEAGSEQYRKAIQQARRKGTLHVQEGVPFKEQYRQIRIKGKALTTDERGETVEKPAQGYSFFEATPETFIPMARGGFDIKFEAVAIRTIDKANPNINKI